MLRNPHVVDVEEDVLPAVLRSDEPVTPYGVEPHHTTSNHVHPSPTGHRTPCPDQNPTSQNNIRRPRRPVLSLCAVSLCGRGRAASRMLDARRPGSRPCAAAAPPGSCGRSPTWPARSAAIRPRPPGKPERAWWPRRSTRVSTPRGRAADDHPAPTDAPSDIRSGNGGNRPVMTGATAAVIGPPRPCRRPDGAGPARPRAVGP